MRRGHRVRSGARRMLFERTAGLAACAAVLLGCGSAAAQSKPAWSAQEQPIVDRISHLRDVPDAERGKVTQQLAIAIRNLPLSPNKLRLANGLANLSTEGDFGHATLEEVATTLGDALREQPPSEDQGKPAAPYVELATLVRYEHVSASLDAPQFAAAMAKLEADDAHRQHADLTLNDLDGKAWTLHDLRGKVVLVNFWATWCPPCRKEMPDLEALFLKFREQGFVVLGVSDEKPDVVQKYLSGHAVTYPVLLDPGRKVNEDFVVEGIPKSYLYDRDGKLVAEAIDMRTQAQFLKMLAMAGLQ